MKRIGETFAATIVLLALCLLAGCGKSEQANPKAETPPTQTKAEGERVQGDQAKHYQEMQQHKQQGNGGQ